MDIYVLQLSEDEYLVSSMGANDVFTYQSDAMAYATATGLLIFAEGHYPEVWPTWSASALLKSVNRDWLAI